MDWESNSCEVICISDDEIPETPPNNNVKTLAPHKRTLHLVKPPTNSPVSPTKLLQTFKYETNDESSKVAITTTPTRPRTVITKILDLCHENATCRDDVTILNKMSQKLSFCDTNEFTFSDAFVHFARKICTKIAKNPSQMHVHLKELYVEAKAKRTAIKKVATIKQEKTELENTNYLPDLVTSHHSTTLLPPPPPPCPDPSSLSLHFGTCKDRQDDSEQPSTSHHVNDTKTEMRIKKLEKLLRACNKKIKSLDERELSLDEMEDENSTYVRTDKYKRKSMLIFNKLCQLTGQKPKTGRITETKFKYDGITTGTRFEEVNSRISMLVNKAKQFPDFCDVLEVVNSANESEKLHLRPSAVEQLAREIFRDIGNELKKRRITDDRENFGCHLTDDYDEEYDPVEGDKEVERKLEENKKAAKIKREEIFETFTRRQLDLEGKGVGLELEEDDESEEEEEDMIIELTDDETKEGDVKITFNGIREYDDYDDSTDSGERMEISLAPTSILFGEPGSPNAAPPDPNVCLSTETAHEIVILD